MTGRQRGEFAAIGLEIEQPRLSDRRRAPTSGRGTIVDAVTMTTPMRCPWPVAGDPKPATMTVELIVHLKTAKVLGIEIPLSLPGRAD
jgi:hypothetical protein